MKTNYFQLKVGQKYLIKHKKSNRWLEVKITHYADDNYPWGEGVNEEERFSGTIDENFEVNILIPEEDSKLTQALEEFSCKRESRLAWLERASRDKKQYPNEANAFEYYWLMSH